ncbi:ATP-grasp domain-containing protein [Coleofasciculus sp. E1-EBD-02]|uniref:ATP-grasp domain-containing protein n=1 Tax=Coleofasciculus sp. E1-EBD-02 TaxID=3068481 RepID=UPI003300DBAD
MLEMLNSALQVYKLKPIKEYQIEQESDERKPCIVFFSEEDRVSLLWATSKILPECAFIVTEPTWVRVEQEGDNSVLYLLEGIGMNEFGQCFHTKFKTPKKITFICNFYTEESYKFDPPILQERAKKFQFYETLADCPISSGIELEEYTDDKLHTRLLAAARGVNVPQTMVFGFSLEKYNHHPINSKVKLIPLSKNISDDEIRDYLTAFPAYRFVIKPSNLMGSMLCTIESKDNLDRAVENFKKCLDSLQDNDSLLVDEFIDSSINDNCNLGARLRVLVTRRPNNVVETSGIICNLGYLDKPISGATSKSFSIDYLCNVLQLTNDQKNQLIDKIKRLGEAVLESIIDYETQHLTHVPPNKQTDFIGLDVFVKKQEGQLEPFLIEVNSHNCEGNLQVYEVQHSPNRTDILDKWVETMLYRSYQYMLKGKNILIINGGDYSKRNDFEFAKQVGINIILIDGNPNHFAVSYSSQFFNIDINPSTKDLKNALAIVEVVRKHGIPVDGVITFCEAYVPLSTLAANFLEKPVNDYLSASIAQSKFLTHKQSLFYNPDNPAYEALVKSDFVEVFALKDVTDIPNIPPHYYPLVIQSDSGACASGVKVIQTEEELRAKFEDYKTSLQTLTPQGDSVGVNSEIIVTPYFEGSQHDITLIISDGKLLAGYVADKGLNTPDISRETTAIMPSSVDKELQENLVQSAWNACHKIDLKDGVFQVEAIHTLLGVKILKIHPHISASYVDERLFNVWDVNLILYKYLIAFGIKPFINKSSLPRIH